MSAPTSDDVDRICRHLGGEAFPPGDLAALRRLRAPHTDALVLWRYLTQWGINPQDDDEVRAWTEAIALLAGAHEVHSKAPHIGSTMQAADVSETRLLRLLRSEGEAYADHARSVLHLISSKGKTGDLSPLVQLRFRLDDAHRESIRRHIASNFYRSEPKE